MRVKHRGQGQQGFTGFKRDNCDRKSKQPSSVLEKTPWMMPLFDLAVSEWVRFSENGEVPLLTLFMPAMAVPPVPVNRWKLSLLKPFETAASTL